jgi:hypothetical protein
MRWDITRLRFFVTLENDKGGQSRMTANKVKEFWNWLARLRKGLVTL